MSSSPSAPAGIDVAHQRRRLMIMLAFDALCVVAAIASVIGFLSFHVRWMGALFVLALIAGFAAQVWLVLGLKGRA